MIKCGCDFGVCHYPGSSYCKQTNEDLVALPPLRDQRPVHPSGITRDPPPVESVPVTEIPREVVYPDGRIGWPAIVQYEIRGDDGVLRIDDLPPTEKTEDPVRASSRQGPEPNMPRPRSEPFRVIVHDLRRYGKLREHGLLMDERHTGRGSGQIIENYSKRTPGGS